MSKLPVWARKPDHKKEVVATSRGWMVKETGEMLKLVKNLDERLKDLHQESLESLNSIDKTEVEVTTTEQEQKSSDDVQSDSGIVEKQVKDTTEEKPKTTRGRPRKSKTTDK